MDSVEPDQRSEKARISVAEPFFFVDVAREPSKLCHEICHVHARELEKAGHAHLRIFFAVWMLCIHIQSGSSQS